MAIFCKKYPTLFADFSLLCSRKLNTILFLCYTYIKCMRRAVECKPVKPERVFTLKENGYEN